MFFYQKNSGVLLLLMLIPLAAQAQISIHGTVKDSADMPVAGAVIMLQTLQDSNIVKTGITDSNGYYAITYPDNTPDILQVNALGFESRTYPLPQKKHADVLLDIMVERQSNEIDEVVVTRKQPLFESRPDRIIFNVSQSLAAAGSDALEILRKAPGIIIHPSDNQIRLSGKGQVKVMLNGRLLHLDGEDLAAFLRSIPGDNIRRIEIITAPPAQYDASGNAGLINIILKKDNNIGGNGMLKAGYEQASRGKMITGGNFNYKKGAWNIYGNLDYSDAKNDITERLSTVYPDQIMHMEDRHLRILKNLSGLLGADYEIHKNGRLNATWMSSRLSRQDAEDISNRLLSGNSVDSVMHTTGNNHQGNRNNSLYLNYEWKADTTGKQLTIDINRLWYYAGNSKHFETVHYTGDFLSPTGISSKNNIGGDQHLDITSMQAALQLPYAGVLFSFGGKWNSIKNRSNNYFQYFEHNRYVNDTGISSSFEYSEQVQALYAQAQFPWKKWDIQLGLRGEFTQTKGWSLTLNQRNSHRYFQLFPGIYLNRNINDRHQFGISYTRRINRPGYKELDPYRAYSSPYFYSEGNPFIQPYFSNNIECNYSFRNRYFIRLFYQLSNKSIGTVWEKDDQSKVTHSTFGNYFNSRNTGIAVMTSLQPLSFWELQVQANFTYEQVSAYYYSYAFRSSIPDHNVYVSNHISLNSSKTWLVEINGFYSGKSQWGYFIWDPFYSVNIGMKALFFDKKLNISLNINDLFNSTSGSKAYNAATLQTLNNDLDFRNVRLSMSLHFGNQKIKPPRDGERGLEEEQSRIK